eukprot:scaffold227802_cov30-Tisochrysis_lutea.AAC.3
MAQRCAHTGRPPTPDTKDQRQSNDEAEEREGEGARDKGDGFGFPGGEAMQFSGGGGLEIVNRDCMQAKKTTRTRTGKSCFRLRYVLRPRVHGKTAGRPAPALPWRQPRCSACGPHH